MKDTIVFKLKANDRKDYSRIGNFILKREKHEVFINRELDGIVYKYYTKNNIQTNKKWIEVIERDKDTFLAVNQPEKIRNITEKYEIIYCIFITEKCDIVELQYIFELKQFYNEKKILILCNDYDNSFYHKVSQYFFTVSPINKDFYNMFYFVENGVGKRMQLNNMAFSRKFVPLQIIDESNIKRLFVKVSNIIKDEDLRKILEDDKKDELKQDSDILSGAVKLLHESKGNLQCMGRDRLYEMLEEMEVLAFILFVYTIFGNKEVLRVREIERYAVRMRQYANAILQLAENIIYHSASKVGSLSIRIHDSKERYFENMYQMDRERNKQDYLEVIISDFSADNTGGDIAETFIKRLSNEADKINFKNMKPVAFFDKTKDVRFKKAWDAFYADSDNIGKHFGLKIFQSIVKEYDGFFIAESHQGYMGKKGETYFSFRDKDVMEPCLPGTRYHIALPLESMHNAMILQDQSLDSGIAIGKNINTILSYCTGRIDLKYKVNKYSSQEEKNEVIADYSEELIKKFKRNKKDITYVSMDNIDDASGEIFAKALIIAFYKTQDNRKLVLYSCSAELKKSIFNTLKVFLMQSDLEGMFCNTINQIILYSKDYEETVIVPRSISKTNSINAYIEHIKCIASTEWYIEPEKWPYNVEDGSKLYIPCDILKEVAINGERKTLFEHYTHGILNKNIQNTMFGCKLEHTHMRLGSTIHIDEFYEAEILFGNKLFVSRFALLLVKDMKEDIKDVEKLTLYGYGTYSESVLVQAIEMIRALYPEKTDVDYIILERQEERRGFLHSDRIRYNRAFGNSDERYEYFEDRKVAVIVLINSTLKTHVRLISFFKSENNIPAENDSWILKNYAVLLVGSKDKNGYWKLRHKNIITKKEDILPQPRYFLKNQVQYYEPLRCSLCFPDNPLWEIPLIEVNAASTIPNQAFGIIDELPVKDFVLEYKMIAEEEEKLKDLKDCLVYGHICRNENHFLYYFKTENFCVNMREDIKESLRKWKDEYEDEIKQQYNIIVAPMHFSNAGFVELVNEQVFDGNAILLRIDFDKEYRSNAHAKYSYLRNYVEQLCNTQHKAIIRVHFVDDSIISGRTIQRAKSLIETILGVYSKQSGDVKIRVFDKIFVLIDRNSKMSRMQYVMNWEPDKRKMKYVDKYFYSFKNINISSMRNYGDSCVLCNLKKEAELLYETSSTAKISSYWKDYIKKFELYTLEELSEIRKNCGNIKSREERAYRRLFCTHMAQRVLNEENHGNIAPKAICLILDLLITDYEERKVDRYEYFLSYLKCISRPFLVFQKSVKEAVFDILLVLIDTAIRGIGIKEVIAETAVKKEYLSDPEIIKKFDTLHKNILNSEKNNKLLQRDKVDLVLIIMKQLTELKSNYIIRSDKMNAIFGFINKNGGKEDLDFKTFYLSLVKRLVGVSSDTNKSIWLDDMILKRGGTVGLKEIPVNFKVCLLLENTRAFRDGIEKLYIKRNLSSEFKSSLSQGMDKLILEYEAKNVKSMIQNFLKLNREELESYKNNRTKESEEIKRSEQKIKNFIKKLPLLLRLDPYASARKLAVNNSDWYEILQWELKAVENEIDYFNDDTLKSRIGKQIDMEVDSYQLSNFKYIMQECGYIKEEGITNEGIDVIICCMEIITLCRCNKTESVDLLQIVHRLAILFNIVLRANSVQFIVERPEHAHLDEWKSNIVKRYNDKIVAAYNIKTDTDETVNEIVVNPLKQYMVIAQNTADEHVNCELDEKALAVFNQDDDLCKEGYWLDAEKGNVIWKLENDRRTVWIQAHNDAWRGASENGKLEIAYAVRRIMIFYQELKDEIFSPQNDDFINEIYQTRRQLNIYHSNKIYDHTKDSISRMHFEHAIRILEEEPDKKAYMDHYPYYILNLLADINVSKYYRRGLRQEFYSDENTFASSAKWRDFEKLFKNGHMYTYEIREESSGKSEMVLVKLEIENLCPDDEILCAAAEEEKRNLMLLLYSLILNAAGEKRGKRTVERRKEQNLQMCSTKKSVIVKVRKNDSGNLEVINESIGESDADEITNKLMQIPESEEDGISLWSFNRYIKSCISAYLMDKLRLAEEKLERNELSKEDVIYIGKRTEELLSEEYDVKLKTYSENGKSYFAVELPVLMERYNWSVCKKEGHDE